MPKLSTREKKRNNCLERLKGKRDKNKGVEMKIFVETGELYGTIYHRFYYVTYYSNHQGIIKYIVLFKHLHWSLSHNNLKRRWKFGLIIKRQGFKTMVLGHTWVLNKEMIQVFNRYHKVNKSLILGIEALHQFERLAMRVATKTFKTFDAFQKRVLD